MFNAILVANRAHFIPRDTYGDGCLAVPISFGEGEFVPPRVLIGAYWNKAHCGCILYGNVGFNLRGFT